MNGFQKLNLGEPLMSAITQLGYQEPTEIQFKSIPILLQGKDLIGQSKTGSGKTAAFLIPTFHRVMNSNDLALILVPTRELALQVEESARDLGSKSSKIILATIIGGASMSHQIRMISQRPNIIIATPGRLVDHLMRGTLRLERLKVLILDEADRMLDMGFLPQIKQILTKTPKARQTIMFSATFSQDIRKLAKEILNHPEEVSVDPKNATPITIDQQVVETTQDRKYDLLLDQLNARTGSVLIFTRTKHKTDKMFKFLNEYGYSVSRIHGDRSLNQRKQAIEEFKTGKVRVLVATDIASRGLDIAQVGHVINFDLPQCPEDYTHRIGRTGRAGSSGFALSFVTPEEKTQWRLMTRNSGTSVELLKVANSGPGHHESNRRTDGSRTERKKDLFEKKRQFFSKPSSSGKGKSRRSASPSRSRY